MSACCMRRRDQMDCFDLRSIPCPLPRRVASNGIDVPDRTFTLGVERPRRTTFRAGLRLSTECLSASPNEDHARSAAVALSMIHDDAPATQSLDRPLFR